MAKVLTYGGYIAGALLIVFGIGMVTAGVVGQNDVRDRLAQERIVGSPDMSPAAIDRSVVKDVPDCDVAGEPIDTGAKAQCFADYMRVHALTITGGETYSEMGRFLDAEGNPTSDEAAAAKDPETGRPVENEARNLWVTETALTTALNTSFFAESVARFSIAVGVVLLLIGIGLGILTRFALAPLMLGKPVRARRPSGEAAAHPG